MNAILTAYSSASDILDNVTEVPAFHDNCAVPDGLAAWDWQKHRRVHPWQDWAWDTADCESNPFSAKDEFHATGLRYSIPRPSNTRPVTDILEMASVAARTGRCLACPFYPPNRLVSIPESALRAFGHDPLVQANVRPAERQAPVEPFKLSTTGTRHNRPAAAWG